MARRRKPSYTQVRYIRPKGRANQNRTVIPQTPYRPIKVSGDALQREKLRSDPYWFIAHRRGVHRPKIGEDPLEARAVSKSTVNGTLPERIVYKALTNRRLIPNIDFDFQSSEQGGRLELGGMVADFLFPNMMFVLNVQGPTHATFLRAEKDSEQEGELADMGYGYYEIWENTIYDQSSLDKFLRRLFDMSGQDRLGEQNGDTYGIPDHQISTIFKAVHQLHAGIS